MARFKVIVTSGQRLVVEVEAPLMSADSELRERAFELVEAGEADWEDEDRDTLVILLPDDAEYFRGLH